MSDLLISIIIPVYNVEKYLSRCIDSLISQSYKNIEIILVNDGSTDNSNLICEKYAKIDNRIKYIKKKNGGVSSARNIGLDNAIGDYISFIDGDDYVENDMYEIMIDSAIKNNSNIVICNFVRENEKGKILRRNSKTKPHISIRFNRNDYSKNLYKYPSLDLFLWNKLYARKLIYKTNEMVKFNENIDMSEDALFNIELLNFNNEIKCVYINKKFYHYMVNTSSITNQKNNNKRLSYLSEKIEEINILEKNNMQTNIQMALYIIFYNNNKNFIKSEDNNYYFETFKNYKKKVNFMYLPLKIKIKYLLSFYNKEEI